MLSNLKRAAAAVATVGAIALMGASSASAGTQFHVGSEASPIGGSGTMALSATAGASRLVVNGSVKLECTGTTASGTISTGLFANSGTRDIGDVIPAFSGCTGPLGLGFTVLCTNPGGGVTTDLAVTSIPTPFTGTVRGEIANIKCVVTLTTGCSATITGAVQGSYQNPATPATAGKLTVFTAGQTLTVSGSACPAIIPNGTAQYGAPVGGGVGLGNIDYTVGGAIGSQPFITPTA